MDIAYIGVAMIAVAILVLSLVTLYHISILTIKICKEKNKRSLWLMGFGWWIIIGFMLLLFGSI